MRQSAYVLVPQDTLTPDMYYFPIFTGMSWMDNTVVKYNDDPFPYYATHTDAWGNIM
jgi:hypothetical protein